MPCLDGRERVEDEHAREGARQLCLLLTLLEAANELDKVPDSVKNWWAEHKIIDRG